MNTQARIWILLGLCLLLVANGRDTVWAASPKEKIAVPAGFVAMEVLGVMDNQGAKAVVLRQVGGETLLPIWIGDTEAFVIQLRINRQRFQRPLTHDLLDAAITKLGGRVVKIHVDDLRDNTFLGKVFIARSGKLLVLDARPSDSIALAVGNQVPIFVSRKVLDSAGIKKPAEPPPPTQKRQQELLKEILESGRDEKTL